jgi:hypothetical protein
VSPSAGESLWRYRTRSSTECKKRSHTPSGVGEAEDTRAETESGAEAEEKAFFTGAGVRAKQSMFRRGLREGEGRVSGKTL